MKILTIFEVELKVDGVDEITNLRKVQEVGLAPPEGTQVYIDGKLKSPVESIEIHIDEEPTVTVVKLRRILVRKEVGSNIFKKRLLRIGWEDSPET